MQQKKRIQSFDGLKGLAIMAVVAYHLFPSVIPGGFFMVNTFLVIGGFFFARNIEKVQPVTASIQWKAIGKYLLHTIERLFIPLLWLLIFIVVGMYLIYPIELRHIRSDIFSGLFFVNNIYQIIADRSYFVQMSDSSPFTHLWYNAIHLQSVLIATGIILLLQRLKLTIPSKGIIWLFIVLLSHVAILFLYTPGDDPTRVYYGIETRFASFAIGVSAAYITPTILNLFYKSRIKLFVYNLLAILSAAGMIWIVFTQSDRSEATYLLWMSVFNVLSMLLVFSITVGAPTVTSWLSLKPFYTIGKRSYSYYLWYYPIIVLYLTFYRELGENIVIVNILSIITLAIVGEVFYRVIESGGVRIWFGSSFKLKDDVEDIGHMIDQRKFLQPKLFIFITYVALMVIFVRGLIYSADNKRVALFELEYQSYQTKPNLLKTAYPLSQPIIQAEEGLKMVDDTFETTFVSELEVEDPVETLQNIYFEQQVLSAELQELIEENQEVFDEFEEYNPIVFDELTPQELLFATEVPVTFLGDSIALHFTPKTDEIFWNGNIYGQGSLQLWDANDILQDMVRDGEVQENLVVVLGTNAGLDQEGMDKLMSIAGEDRNVFFVNTNSRVMHIQSVNDTIKDTAKKHPNAYEVDWYSYQQGNPDWYTEDEVHHTPEGMEHFAVVVTQTMYDELGELQNEEIE